MLKSVGLDIVETARIKKMFSEHGQRFVDKILSIKEIEVFNKRKDNISFLSGRFAAKEAIIKGLGVYLENKPAFKDIEIINDKAGQPIWNAQLFLNKKVICHLSISHEKKYAAAVAVFTEE